MSEDPKALKYVSVILDVSINKPLDYLVPDKWLGKIKLGMRIVAPLRGVNKRGYIYEVKKTPSFPKLKPLAEVLPENTWIKPELFKLATWMSKYYLTSLDRVFRCMTPPMLKKEVKEKTLNYLSLNKTKKTLLETVKNLRQKSPHQARALEFILKENGAYQKNVLETLKITSSPIESLIRKKLIKKETRLSSHALFTNADYFQSRPKKFNDEQRSAFDAISKTLDQNLFHTHLLYGVTGSGKTEVYMQLIQKALDQDKSVIVLVPEVALTSQLIEKFRARFTEPLAIFHHKRSLGERSTDWEKMLEGKAKIVLGARSAVFSPAPNLGLIIIDEEHDASYKQTEEMPCYHARDVAIMRAKMQNACIILGSATPALETFHHAKTGKYALSTLKVRATKASLPQVELLDMLVEKEKAGSFTHFSKLLLDEIVKREKMGEQTLLFLNRRGYYTSQICKNCSHVISCPSCDLALTYHKKDNLFRCHLCDYTLGTVRKCPTCQSLDTFLNKGFGTEHIERSLKALFPDIKTLRMDRDTTRKKTSHEDLIFAFKSGKASVLIGTQMIAKGLHFPLVSLVGVINTDGALSIPDFRAGESVFQLITQVAGRAGREALKGKVIIQTHMPSHPTLKLAKNQDYDAFFEKEIQERKDFLYPPFSRLIKFVFSSEDELLTKKLADAMNQELARLINEPDELYPVIPCHHARIKNRYRFQFLLKTVNIQKAIAITHDVKTRLRLPPSVKLLIDVDPVYTT